MVKISRTTSVVIPPDLREQIASRGDQSTVIRESLERYYMLIRRELPLLRANFTLSELALIANACNGTLFDSRGIPHLADDIEDSIQMDHTDIFYAVDGIALLDQLRALDPAATHALVDAVERYWHRIGAGEDPPPRVEEILE